MPITLHRAREATLDAALAAAVKRSRKLLNKRALISLQPVTGLDWVVDAALLSRLIPEINKY